MDHDTLKGLLSDYLDGELEAAARRRVEEHLSSCAECRRSLEEWKAAGRVFFSPPPKPSLARTEAFVSRVMARLPAPAEPAPSFDLSLRWLFPALAFSFASLALSFVPPGEQEQDPSTALLLAAGGGDRVSEWIAGPDPEGLEALLEVEAR